MVNTRTSYDGKLMLRNFSLFIALVTLTAQDSPDTVQAPTKRFHKSTVVSGLNGPWEITWGPDNMIWTTERVGKRVSRVNPQTGEVKVAATIAEVSVPGGQDGLLGMALHPELLKGTGNDFVYVAYTYVDKAKGPDAANVPDENNPYRYLYMKVARFDYKDGKLSNPVNVITGLPAGNDHAAGRLKFGPDKKLYLTIGDQGHNQLGNVCLPIGSQLLPTKAQLDAKDYVTYVGKTLRMNIDGSVPADNPKLAGVVSHVYTYGHRNPQGIDFAPDGTLYETEHGPKTDDEVNILKKGGNYGWPHVAGLQDGKAYEFARWAEAKTPCKQLTFSDLAIHPSVPREPESAFKLPMVPPLATMFTVDTGFNFSDPKCKGIDYICWPTVGVSSVEHYQSKGIPGWDRVLLITTLKRGSLYIQPLKADGQVKDGYMSRYFKSENRFRDTAVSPDGKTIYIATDPGGLTESSDGGVTRKMRDAGAILAFTYKGEGSGTVTEDPRVVSSKAAAEPLGAYGHEAAPAAAAADAGPPQFTAAQVAAGKTAYNANCAVCHGSTGSNGTFGTPVAGDYFKRMWTGRSVRTFFDRAEKTMPPAAPGSLPKESYASIVAYILDLNGFKSGSAALPAGGAALEKMSIK
jgi:PQQ-dependent dehydrogenase (s-GDH family)